MLPSSTIKLRLGGWLAAPAGAQVSAPVAWLVYVEMKFDSVPE